MLTKDTKYDIEILMVDLEYTSYLKLSKRSSVKKEKKILHSSSFEEFVENQNGSFRNR